jgi:rare lipoprotein A
MLGVAVSVTAASISIAASSSGQSARLSPSERELRFGERLGLGGSVPGNRGMDVRLKFRPAGSNDWKLVRKTHTNRNGIYRTRVTARSNGAFRAVPARGRSSVAEAIRVKSRTAFHVARHHVILGSGVRVSGRVRPGGRRAVKIVARGPDGRLVRDGTSRAGRFAAAFRATRPGTYRLRAHGAKNRKASGSGSAIRRVNVYRYAAASWYGPGFYGNTTACGGTLTRSTLGVAHKTLPCGTKVKLRYGKRTVRVPVIDRGPYAAGRVYDLTYATKQRLGFPDTGYVLSTK